MSDTHFDSIVIGSGFGGSVMAYRLADAGQRVCVLERGQAYPPNSFPRAPFKMKRNFWDPSAGFYGMFNVWSFKGSGALVSSGLGGGSLIYANVLIRKDEKWFIKEDLNSGGYESWPVTYQDLDEHYEEVERMMNVQKYPFFTHEPYKGTPKTTAMKEAAESLRAQNLDARWQLLNLAVSFRTKPVDDPDHPDDQNNPPLVGEPIIEAEGQKNLHSKTRYTCRLCGECDIGCNFGSKNTLDYTYLSAAKNLQNKPADIRTLCEVKSFEPRAGGGFTVRYVVHNINQTSSSGQPTVTLTCDRLILSAGTFSTPYLLFTNRSAFPRISNRLGSRFCVNGDLLSFIRLAHERKNGERVPRILDPSFGPVITSAIRLGDTLDGNGTQGRGFYTEDGGNPDFINWLLESTAGLAGFLSRTARLGGRSLWQIITGNRETDLGAEIAGLIGPTVFSKSSMPVLTMGRDIPNGKLFLRGKFLDCDWNIEKSQEYYNRVVNVVSRIARALDAEYMDNPSYQYLKQVITAHPLGGCPMGDTKEQGVVNSFGEVFDYPGLYIADGSVLPGPVGPNPSLTIAALADRFAQHIIDTKGA